jgi:type IV secretory pathway VirB3-like protein
MREAIYKGATRPALLAGVPLEPAVLVGGLAILASFNVFALARSIAVPVLMLLAAAGVWGWMVVITRRDDQRLRQVLIALRLRPSQTTLALWRCSSYAPGVARGMALRLRRR